MICSQVIVGDGTVVRKELVTNLTSDENLVNASLFLSEGICSNAYTFIEKYQEGDNWIFVYDINPNCNYVELGAGAALSKFISVNFITVSILFLSIIGFAVVWMWRDAVTKNIEVVGKMADNSYNCVQSVLNDDTLTSEQKDIKIQACLKLAPPVPTDWTTIAIIGAAALLGYALITRSK